MSKDTPQPNQPKDETRDTDCPYEICIMVQKLQPGSCLRNDYNNMGDPDAKNFKNCPRYRRGEIK